MTRLSSSQSGTIALLLGSVLIFGGLASCGKPQTPEALIAEARQYREHGDIPAAIIQLKNALQKNPDDAEARYLLGTIYNETSDPQSAEKELRRALDLGKDPARVLPELGKALLIQGQFQKVLDETNPVSGENESPEISSLRGNAYLALGKPKEAKESFERALSHEPDFPDALIGLARQALTEQNIEAATRYIEQAVDKNPKNVGAWLFKADLLRLQGQIKPALAAYENILKLEPKNTSAHLSKAFLEIGTGNFDAAKADIDAARQTAPNSLLVFYSQALLDFRQGKHAEAWDSLQQILRAAPEHMPSVLLAGAVQYSLGSMPQAEQYLKQFLGANPGNYYARHLLISILLKSRQTTAALKQLEPMLKDGQPQDARTLALAGEAYMQAKDYTKATEYFEKASAIIPGNPKLHAALGLSSLAQGQDERAVSELETAASLDTQSPQTDVLLIMNYLRRQENDKAMAAVRNLEKEQPGNPLTHNMKGAVYLAMKDAPSARASFEKALSLQPTYFPAAMNLAQLDLKDKNPSAAQKRLEAFLEKDKDNLQAMLALARLASAQGQNNVAETWLQRASQAHPEATQPGQLLVGLYQQTGEKKKALDLAQKLQASHPQSPEMLALLAQIHLANGNKDKALDAYERLAVLRPESALAQFRIASVHMDMQNTQAAYDALKKALALQPNYLEAKLALAGLEALKGNREEALKMAQNIQKQHGKSPAGYVLEGDLLMAQNKPALAAKAYEKGLSVGKSAPQLIKLHTALSRDGKGKEAESRLLQWLKEHPTDNPVRLYLANSYLVTQQNKAAIEQYQTILRQDPKNVVALNNLASLYQKEKDPRALQFAEQAYQLAPEHPAILDTLGWILVEQGNTGRGLPLLQKAANLAPKAGEIRYHYVLGLVKSGDKPKARQELERLLATKETFPQIEEAKTLLKQLQPAAAGV